MDEVERFDVIVIGAGPAGEVIAGRLGEAGKAVALVEHHLVGGECSFYACMPSKALLRPAEALWEIRRIPGAAEAANGDLDVEAALARRDEVIHNLDDSSQLPWLEKRKVKLFRGYAEMVGKLGVQVQPQHADESHADGTDNLLLEARDAVVVATGSVNAMPPIEGLREAHAWSNREATTAKQPPKTLIVLGGGPVGVELSQAWTTLGSKVTLIEGERRLLPREEEFACQQVTESLTELGVDIRCGSRVTRVERAGNQFQVTTDDGSTINGERVLAALGRRPATTGIGLEAVGLEAGKPLAVDDDMRVEGHDWLYAVGDVNGKVLLTHMGKYQARIAADHILGKSRSVHHGADGPLSPRVTFTEPQVAAVGYTLKGAKEKGINARAVDTGTSDNAGGSFYGRGAPGTARIVVDQDRDVIVGATITGAEVADFIHAATIAIVGEVPLSRLWHAVPSFPTRSELWLALLEHID